MVTLDRHETESNSPSSSLFEPLVQEYLQPSGGYGNCIQVYARTTSLAAVVLFFFTLYTNNAYKNKLTVRCIETLFFVNRAVQLGVELRSLFTSLTLL